MTVATLVQEYPQFVANQVLTQDQLNNMRDFLDHQNRLTRVRLVGIGIVCGLHVRLESDGGTDRRLIISEGYGVTSDGWLIQIEETEYTFIQDYDDPYLTETEGAEHPVYLPWQTAYDKFDIEDLDFGLGPGANRSQIPLRRLLTADDPILPADKTDLIAADLQNKVLVLYLELDETELKSCFTTDCNNKGQSIKLNIRALLADRADRFLPASDCKTLGDLQSVPRFNTGLKMIFGIEMPNIDVVPHLNQTYIVLSDYLGNQLNTKVDTLFTANEAFFDIQDVATKVSDFQTGINDILAAPSLGQYRYDILKDITQAYNELVLHLCEIIEPCCNTEHFPRHLVIKEFGNPPTTSNPAYRHPFYPSPVRNVMHRDYKKAQNLFKRVLDLATSFQVNDDGIKITPSQNEAYPLAKRAIPHYYQPSISQIWQLNACCTPPVSGYVINRNAVADMVTTPTADDYLSPLENPLHYNINACSHLQIEGHVGENQDTAENQITQIREEHNLDFQIFSLPLRAQALNLTAPDDITERYLNLENLWVELYKRIDDGSIDKDEFESSTDQIQVEYVEIINTNNAWCDSQMEIELPCDYEAVQSDYSILRAELLCFLHRCKPMFNNLPDVDFGGDSDPTPQDKQFCLELGELPEGTEFNPSANQPGEVIFTEEDVAVSLELYNGTTNLGSGRVVSFGTDIAIELFNINLRFNLDPDILQCRTQEVRFEFRPMGGNNNIGINLSLDPMDGAFPDTINFEGIANQGPQTLSNGYELEITSNAATGRFLGIVRGDDITSVTLGGQEFRLFNFCVEGEDLNPGSGGNPINLPPYIFEARFKRIQILCQLLEAIATKDILCFNHNLFRLALKDFTGAAIEIKLLLGCILYSVNGAFNPYRYYPIWNDLEDCLDHLSGTCLLSRFITVHYNFRAYWNAGIQTFGAFVEKYPGAEHRAGVNKGGTFIMVYEDANNPAVLGDFSLEHYVDDCCLCDVDFSTIDCPPIALSDYRITTVEDQGSPVELEIRVIGNDFDLAGMGALSISPSELHESISDRGANLVFDEAAGIVRYELSDSGQNVLIDHFTYLLIGSQGIDIGHVYVAVFPPKQNGTDSGGFNPDDTTKPQGQGTGTVIDSQTGISISGAIVEIFNPNGARAEVITTGGPGRFDFVVAPSTYSFRISHVDYLDATFNGNVIEDGQAKDFGLFQLRRNNLDTLDDRFGAREGVIRDVDDALKNEVVFGRVDDFVTNTIKDENKPLEEVSKDYQAIMAELVDLYKATSDTAIRKDATAIMESMTHSYMDRAVVHQSKEANEDALLKVEDAVGKMKGEGISVNRILNNWKSNDLRTAIGGESSSISKFREKFKN